MSGGERSSADPALVAALATGSTIQRAAEIAGVSDATARRRLREPAFRVELEVARQELVERAVGALADHAASAALTLHELTREEHPPQVRLGASRALLELALRRRELLGIRENDVVRMLSGFMALALERLPADSRHEFIDAVYATVRE